MPSILDNRIKELPDEILNNFPPARANDIPMISFAVKMTLKDLEYMKQYETNQNKIKQENISDNQQIKLNHKDELNHQLPQSKRYRLSVASKRMTTKKILEDAGIPGAKITSDVNKLLQLIITERKATKRIQKKLEKYVHLCKSLDEKLNIYQKNK